jgi:hypothetical protein
MEAAVPEDCTILKPACDEQWQRLAAVATELRRVRTFMHHCPGSSADAQRFEAYQKGHRVYLGHQEAKLTERIDQAIASAGDGGRQRWKEHQLEAQAAKPFPCLSFACADW